MLLSSQLVQKNIKTRKALHPLPLALSNFVRVSFVFPSSRASCASATV